jgi:hypothetical protein
MSQVTSTTNDSGTVVLRNEQHQDEFLTFATGGTVVRGTILARDGSSLKLVPFVKGGTIDSAGNGNGAPKAVIDYDVTAAGAGDVRVRVLVRGVLSKVRLVIAADGDASRIDAGVADQLRMCGFTLNQAQQLAT